jgi:hypothetical protein
MKPLRYLTRVGLVQLKLTDHVAAMRIQYQWRKFLIRRLLRRLVRKEFRRVLDPITGKHCYWTPDGQYLRRKPYLLGPERWQPDNMHVWSERDVIIFLRKMGLRQYVDSKSPVRFQVRRATSYFPDDA